MTSQASATVVNSSQASRSLRKRLLNLAPQLVAMVKTSGGRGKIPFATQSQENVSHPRYGFAGCLASPPCLVPARATCPSCFGILFFTTRKMESDCHASRAFFHDRVSLCFVTSHRHFGICPFCRAIGCGLGSHAKNGGYFKQQCQTSAQAILVPEKMNPGWKVVNVKEHSKHGGITMNKQKLFSSSDETARQSSYSDDRKTIVSKNILERHQPSR